MLYNYYDSYGYKLPESFITMAERKGVKFPPSKTISQKRTELESFFSESGQMTGDLNQSPLLMKPIPEPQHDYSKDYLTFEALEDGNIFFVFNESVTSDLLRYISYSTDNGESWITEENPYTEQKQGALRLSFGNQPQGSGNTDSIENAENIESDIEEIYIDASDVAIEIDKEDDNGNSLSWKDIFGKKSQNGLVTIPVVAGDKIIFKGDATTYGVMNESSVPDSCHFGSDCKFNIFGNIMSLCYEDDFSDKKTLTHECQFSSLFRDDNSCRVVDASNLSLPATALTESCYRTFFHSCSDLVSGPQLPATKLAPNCYKSFYYNCSSLVSVGDLKNVQMYYRSCQFMFYKCSSLKKAPKLPSTKLAEACYQQMFRDCSSLTEAPKLPATKLYDSCYFAMFYNCSSLAEAPELQAKSIPTSGYAGMFYGTLLENAPELPATTLGEGCYKQMFQYCKSLKNSPELPAMNVNISSYVSMFHGCSALTNINKIHAKSISTSGCSYMFAYCASLERAPELSATTLGGYCYVYMFGECTSMIYPPKLPATTLATYCYGYMFYGCTSLTAAPELPAMNLATWCYGHMFEKCTSLTTAPTLPAKTLVSACYRTLFGSCSSLNYIKCLAEDLGKTESSNPLLSWVGNVSPTGTFVKKTGVEWTVDGWNGIPSGWEVEEVDV